MGSPPKWASPAWGVPSGGSAPKEEEAGRATSGLHRGAHLGPAAALGRPSHVGFSPTWLSQGGWPPPSNYIEGHPSPFWHPNFSL